MIWGFASDLQQVAGVAAALITMLLWLVLEARAHRRALASIRIRVHIGGSRGKTSVARYVGAGLRKAGLRVLVKTTGTVPLLIMPDGSERQWTRWGPPNIGEQVRLMRLARRLQVNAVVIESMAVQPEYLWASERYLVQATDTVITNLRPDHEEDVGSDPSDHRAALGLLVPRNARLILSAEASDSDLVARARQRDCVVTTVPSDSIDGTNLALALEVCAGLYVDRETAAAGIAEAGSDAGQFFVTDVATPSGRIILASAFACNDVSSFLRLWREHQPRPGTVVLFNGRADRPLRTHAFLAAFADLEVRVFLAGSVPKFAVRRAGLDPRRVSRLKSRRAATAMAELAAAAGPGAMVWGTGNFAGIGARVATAYRPADARC